MMLWPREHVSCHEYRRSSSRHEVHGDSVDEGRPMAHENDRTLVVQTLSGTIEHEFNIHQSLQHVVDYTIDKLKLHTTPDEVWELRLGSTLLNVSQTIAQAGIPDHAVLKLAPREKGG